MTPSAMITTALLLGGFVLAGGAYGLLYCMARMSNHSALRAGGYLSYAALCLIAFALMGFTPLHLGWKFLIAASCAIYLVIPPVTWRYLTRLHREEALQ